MAFYRLLFEVVVLLGVTGRISLENLKWNRFATSKSYENTILVTRSSMFAPLNISKEKLPFSAKMGCVRHCIANSSCVGCNFFEVGETYICQLLAENFCRHKNPVVLRSWPGGLVFDKLNASTSQSCIDQLFEVQAFSNYCAIARPGCQGVWPDCNDCARSCYDYSTKLGYANRSYYQGTVWPEGASSEPIFALCVRNGTHIMRREVNVTSGSEIENYIMSFRDMERLSQLKIYRFWQFSFLAVDGVWASTTYKISSINTNGTFSNISLYSGIDGLSLNGTTVSLDFRFVTNDLLGCGSFFLLEPQNATYCPGGRVSLFGKPSKTGSVISTGIRWPPISNKTLCRGNFILLV